MKTIYNSLLRLPSTFKLSVIICASLFFNQWAAQLLNENYAASQFPVPYYTAQLSFSAEKLKAWYGFLIEHDTLNQYIHTQNVDSLFILSTLLLHVSVLLLISRLFGVETKGRKALVVCAILSSIAPISDQLENLVSYVMLSDPAHFSQYLAYIYSSFAAVKFAFFVFAYATAGIGLIIGVAYRVKILAHAHQKCYGKMS